MSASVTRSTADSRRSLQMADSWFSSRPASNTTLDLEGSRLYAIGFGFFRHDYFPSLIITGLFAILRRHPLHSEILASGKAAIMSTRSLAEMFNRLLQAEGQTRAARSVEYFGWIDLVLGITILVSPY